MRSPVARLLYAALCAQFLLLPLEAGPQTMPQTTFANDSNGLREALMNHNVERISLSSDISLQPQDWQGAVFIGAGRHVVITAAGAPNFTATTTVPFPRSVSLNFSSLWPVITVSGGASLQFENLVLVGLRNPASPGLEGIKRVRGLLTWPTINADPGAEIILSNVFVRQVISDCSPAYIQQQIRRLWDFSGPTAALNLPEDPLLILMRGYNHLLLPVVPINSTEPSFGTVWFTGVGGAIKCEQDPLYSSSASSGNPTGNTSTAAGGGSSTPWWVWLIVGLTAAGALLATALGLTLWRASRRVGLALKPPDAKAGFRSGYQMDEGQPTQPLGLGPDSSAFLPYQPHTLTDQQQPQRDPCSGGQQGGLPYHGFGHALRLRFGDLHESVELGELIGKGAFGRVYKARWKGAPAAIKVVEHSMPSSSSTTTAPPSLETILATALSHPNLVATYKVSQEQVPQGSQVTLPMASGPPSPTQAADPSPWERVVSESAEGLPASPAGIPAAAAKPMGGGSRVSNGHHLPGSSTGEDAANPSTPAPLAPGGQPKAFLETWLVLEYCDMGSLAQAISNRKFHGQHSGQPLMHAILLCLQDIARGMEYLHSNNVIHGDLKPANVLFKSREDGSQGFTCKIADLGLSRLLDPEQSHRLTRSIGTIGYMPPEMLTAGRLTTACDVYSFGILMWELATCQVAFADLPAAQILFRVVHLGERPKIPQVMQLPADYVSLMRRCWAVEPEHRPHFSQVAKELAAIAGGLL